MYAHGCMDVNRGLWPNIAGVALYTRKGCSNRKRVAICTIRAVLLNMVQDCRVTFEWLWR